MTVIELSTDAAMLSVHGVLRAAAEAQRDRMRDLVDHFALDGWDTASGCDGWSRRDLLLHLRGAQQRVARSLDEEPPPPSPTPSGPFDPNRSPQEYIDRFPDLTGTEVGVSLLELMSANLDRMDRLGSASTLRTAAVWGSETDWRILGTHIFWDALHHERDLGSTVRPDDDSLLLALAYGTLMGSLTASFRGEPAGATFGVSNPSATVSVNVGDLLVEVEVRAGGGKGPDLLAAFDALGARTDDPPDELLAVDGPVGVSFVDFQRFLRG